MLGILQIVIGLVFITLIAGTMIISNYRHRRRLGYGISLLVPFRDDAGGRAKALNWLVRYWLAGMPRCEVVIGNDDHVPFCKTGAVNDAFRRSAGDIVVIMDADCYIDIDVILDCARQIRRARRMNRKLWFIPYRHFYRLTKAITESVLESNPAHPFIIPSPPPEFMTEYATGYSVGHWFGALIQIMPREAFIAAGGMDERFNGWGGEDVSFMKAVDTLYTPHMASPNQVTHLWHPHTGTLHTERTWDGQAKAGNNNPLAHRYIGAYRRKARMEALTREDGSGTP